MRTQAVVFKCDICGAEVVACYPDHPLEGWKEFLLDDYREAPRINQTDDLCPKCANKLMHYIEQIRLCNNQNTI